MVFEVCQNVRHLCLPEPLTHRLTQILEIIFNLTNRALQIERFSSVKVLIYIPVYKNDIACVAHSNAIFTMYLTFIMSHINTFLGRRILLLSYYTNTRYQVRSCVNVKDLI